MSKRIKRNNDELKADRPTINEVKFIPRLPISILVENVRSVHNVGSIFRSADGFGAEKIYLSGYTAYPPREDLHKTALGAEDAVPWEYFENPLDVANTIKNAGISLVLIEQTQQSQHLGIFPKDDKYEHAHIEHNRLDYPTIGVWLVQGQNQDDYRSFA